MGVLTNAHKPEYRRNNDDPVVAIPDNPTTIDLIVFMSVLALPENRSNGGEGRTATASPKISCVAYRVSLKT